MMPHNHCVYIVDDDASVRDSLAVLLGLKGYRTQSFASGEEFLQAYRPTGSACMLLDVKMAGMGGLELQNALRERRIHLPIIVITAHGDVPTARAALIAGAVDFLEKPVDPELLLATLHTALEGDAARRSAARKVEEEQRKLKVLTARERQIMELIAGGTHNRDIATALGISPRTVEGHKARVLDKLQVRSVTELVHLVLAATPDAKLRET
ncbi:MAG TPA: response regulator [Burkholderiales bacterium]|jgi:FixJ family two-component response regulator|nr:response regulator [Burkholderiales bacterium]